MKIVFVASEMVPYAKTGGLADVIGSLPSEVRKLGHEAVIFIPRYKVVDAQRWGLRVAVDRLEVLLGTEKETGRIYHSVREDGVQVYFVDHPEFFHRDCLYGTALGDYPDNDRRFTFFQRTVLETLKVVNFSPEIVHCHDWQTGLIPVYLKTLYAGDRFFHKAKTVFTVHNLSYQGNFPPDSLAATGLGWEHFRMERLEFYGKISFLKGGLLDADTVTTVSERYAQEIQSKEFGAGMEGVLARRRDTVFGIVNGIDPEEWNPEKDRDLAASFSLKRLDKRGINKAALQKENGFSVDPKIPLLGFVARLVEQKGMDILIPAVGKVMQLGTQVVVLGTGEEKYHQALRDLAKKYKGRFGIHILFDAKMAKRIYAGSDFMLFPSYYEPCGLGQMIALRYGSVPIVRATGGLADTVEEFDPRTGKGNGFSFIDYTQEALIEAMERSLAVFREPENRIKLVTNAMTSDFSWAASAKKYVRFYETTKKRPLEGIER